MRLLEHVAVDGTSGQGQELRVKITRLLLDNFRGFQHLELQFHPRLTVLVGVNGAGKSSILEAIALLLSSFVESNCESNNISFEEVLSFQVHQLREGASEGIGNLDFQTADDGPMFSKVRWYSGLKRELYEGCLPTGYAPQKASPFALRYGVSRAVLDTRPAAPLSDELLAPMQAYRGALQATSVFREFFDWFRAREDLENEVRLRDNPAHRDPQMEAVRRAVAGLLPGFDGLRVRRRPQQLVISKGGQELSLDQLSDGEKCLLAMVGDIARRLAMTGAEHLDPLQKEALVMIDEIELHLHPRWQREVVPALLRTFPGCQFVLTTHSPQVLGSVPSESVRLLDRFQVFDTPAMTKGRDSTSILVDVMGMSEHPGETAAQLRSIAEQIDQENLPRAREEIDLLAKDLGESDREVLRLRSLVAFLGG